MAAVRRLGRGGAAALVLALASIAATPALAGVAEDRAALGELQAADLRLQSVAWRLATGNARFCDARPAIGLLLQDTAAYGDPDRMRAAAGVSGDIAVEAVVPGSPAAGAGLAPNDEIVAIGDRPMAALDPAAAGTWQRLSGLHDAIDADLARDGHVRLSWRKPGESENAATITGVPACPSRFELLDSGQKASADGTRVVIGRDFAGFTYAEDELAAALAHEFAHNLLAHRAWLKPRGRTQKAIRLTEGEADRLMPWLLVNAGYDPTAAVRFFERWGPRHGGGLFRKRSHEGWDERADAVRRELAEVQRQVAATGVADWRAHFRRDTGA